MRVERWPLERLREDSENARTHDARNKETIRASLGRFGQQKPLVVLEDGTVVAGNGTLGAAKELGWETVEVAVWGCDDADQARAYAIADNRTSELAEWDEVTLAEQLQGIGGLASFAGWDDDEVDDALADAELAEVHEQDDDGRTRDRAGRFFDTATRALMVKLPLDDFRWATTRLEEIGKREGLDSNAEAFTWALERTQPQQGDPKGRAVYLVGAPATGKSAAMAALMEALSVEMGEAVQLEGLLKGVTLTGQEQGVMLGAMRDRFPGTDALSMAASPDAVRWASEGDLPGLVLGEGARLGTAGFLAALGARMDLTVGWLTADEATLDRRCAERGSAQADTYRRGAATRAANAAREAAAAGVRVVTIDTTERDPEAVAATLLEAMSRAAAVV